MAARSAQTNLDENRFARSCAESEERDESGRLRGEVERLKAEVKSMIEIQAGSQGVAVQQAQLPLREALAQSEAALAEQQKMYGDRVDELERLVEQSGERARDEEAAVRGWVVRLGILEVMK